MDRESRVSEKWKRKQKVKMELESERESRVRNQRENGDVEEKVVLDSGVGNQREKWSKKVECKSGEKMYSKFSKKVEEKE